MVDYNIVIKCKEGQADGFKKLYDQTISYICCIVKSYIFDTTMHQDLVQDCYARIFTSLNKYDPSKGEFKPWLRKVAVNECLMYLRNKNQLTFSEIEINSDALLMSINDNSINMDREAIHQMLKEMPVGYRTVFLMIAIDEYTHEEVAQVLNITQETSRSQYMRARKWVVKNILEKDKIKQYGFLQ